MSSMGLDMGTDYNWKSLEDGTKEMKENNLPGIVFIVQTWGGAGRELGKSMNTNQRMKDLASRFVMILVTEKDEPEDEKWNPGSTLVFLWWIDSKERYYPRVFFVDKDLNIDYEVNNTGFSPSHLYYYYNSEHIYRNAIEYLTRHELVDADWEFELPSLYGLEDQYDDEL